MTHVMSKLHASAFALVAASSLVIGCQSDLPEEEPTARIDLRSALNVGAVSAIGVAVAPDTGAWVLFDEQSGIYELDAAGSATMVMDVGSIPSPEGIRYPFTDIVALGQGEFAITAIGDGFLLNVAEGTLTQHFCYVPDGLPAEMDQRADALTYDSERQVLLAQPQTFDAFSGDLVTSQIAIYDRVTGTDLEWHDVGDATFIAGGMVVEADGNVLLGEGSNLHRFHMPTRTMFTIDTLSRFGVGSVDGLAIDRNSQSLLVMDNTHDELVVISLNQLGD